MNDPTSVARGRAGLLERLNPDLVPAESLHGVLAHMPHGIVVLNEELHVSAHYSTVVHEYFESDELLGKTLEETLFARAELSCEALTMNRSALLFSFGMPEHLARANWDHLIKGFVRLDARGQAQHFVLEWTPLIAPDHEHVEGVMLTVREETSKKSAEAQADRRTRELDILHKIVSAGLRDFQAFSFQTRQRINDNVMLCDEENLRDEELVRLLFRNLHTIKGNARLLGLDALSELAHLAEEPVHIVRRTPVQERDTALLHEASEAIESALFALLRGLQKHERVLADCFGDLLGHQQAVDPRVLMRMRQEVDRALHEPSHAIDRLQTLRMLLSDRKAISLHHVVHRTSGMFASLAEELGKREPTVDLIGRDVWMTYGFSSTFQDVLMHVFRNAIDHGIEHPHVREAAGKHPVGRVAVRCLHDPCDGAVIEIEDDGAGIHLAKLRRHLSLGDETDDEEVAQRIFSSGVSLAQTVSLISGRGVGMDAVSSFLVQKGGKVRVLLRPKTPWHERGHVPFFLRMHLPQSELIALDDW